MKRRHRPESVVALDARLDAVRGEFPHKMGRGTSDAQSRRMTHSTTSTLARSFTSLLEAALLGTLLVGVALAPRPALAQERDPMEHMRFEGTLGFLGGWAGHSDAGLSGSLPPSAFESGAVPGTPIAGLRYDVRLVVAFVRMTAGADLAWGMFRASDTARPVTTPDGEQTLVDRSLFLWALRFGLGLEATLDDRVRLFADLTGSVRFLEVGTSLDGVSSSQSAVTFAPGLRLGARFRIVDSFFVQVGADASPFGPWIAGDVSVGGAIE